MKTAYRLAMLWLVLAMGCAGASAARMEDGPSGQETAVRTEAAGDDDVAVARLAAVPEGEPTRGYAPTMDASEASGMGSTTPAAQNAPATTVDGEQAVEPPPPQSWRRVTNATRFATVSLGGGESLQLRRVRVTVEVEGLRARTVVDHIFYNPHARAVEGTFRYALPPESTISSYAMFLGSGQGEPQFFGPDDALRRREEAMQTATVEELASNADRRVWGELRVGRITRAERAREVYENVTRRRIDPALVEEVAPNTFEARVFPIQANGYNRVIVSYEQTLPRVGGELEAIFPVAAGDLESFDFTLTADRNLVRSVRNTSDLRILREASRPGTHVFSGSLRGESQGGNLSFRLVPANVEGPVEVLAGTNPERQEDHFFLRVTADERVPRGRSGYAEQAVFLLDTSLSEHPDRFAIDVALLRGILERSPGIRRFNVVTFDAGARWLAQDWLTNDEGGRDHALEALQEILLEGATDFSAALRALAHPPMQGSGAADVFVLTDGAVSWGERDPATMMAAFEAASPWQARFFAYRTGLGAENSALLRRVTASGATFNCLSTASVPACSTAHHANGFRVERVAIEGTGAGGARASDVLVAGGAATLAPGAEMIVAGRLDRPGDATLRIDGRLAGQPSVLRIPVTIRPRGTLAPRAWAEVAVAQLQESHDRELEDLAVAIAQHYRVPSRLTSFLVLETDAEYEQYNLEQARADVRGADVGQLVAGAARQGGTRSTSWERLRRILERGGAHDGLQTLDGGAVYRRLAGYVSRGPVDMLPGRTEVPAVRAGDAPRRYRNRLSHDADELEMYRDEANRRHEDEDVAGAIRALSSIVENDPSSAEKARLVAYTMGAWGADGEAAELLLGVLERRPYEPQSYRDLANVLWTQRPSMTALLFEAVLAGHWDARFRGLSTVVQEEYGLFSRDYRRRFPRTPLAGFLAEREQALNLTIPESALRVTMTWNTDNTDIDLWVTDPDGEKCYYAHRNIATGGVLLDDVTQGFGPERFQSPEADDGAYLVQAHYYGNNGNRLVAETHVTLTVATNLGTAQEQVRRYNVTLRNPGDVATIARVRVR